MFKKYKFKPEHSLKISQNKDGSYKVILDGKDISKDTMSLNLDMTAHQPYAIIDLKFLIDKVEVKTSAKLKEEVVAEKL